MKESIFFLLFTNSILGLNAQSNDTIIRYANNVIAIKKKHQSIYFYNSSGNLKKIIDLNTKKITHFGLPKEVESIIYNLEAPVRIEVFEETFPTYLFTQKYSDNGIVLCKERIFYNKIGLKTGYIEKCPDDISADTIYFGGRGIYKYNQFGLLISGEEGISNEYNKNGQLIARYSQNKKIKKADTIYNYKYKNNKLTEAIKKHSDTLKTKYIYWYDSKGLLTEIISTKSFENYKKRRKSILFEYNNLKQINKVSEVHLFRGKEYKHTFLTYQYDAQNRINKIKINNKTSYPDKEFRYIYDIQGNLIKTTLNGKLFKEYKYNNKDMLIHINNRWGEEKGYVRYN